MDQSKDNIQSILYEGLNHPDFLFQDLCVDILEKNWRDIGWRIEAKEYPVSTLTKDTRIDIILRDRMVSSTTSPERYTVVECKRINTSYTRAWLFGRPSEPTQRTAIVTHIYEDANIDKISSLATPIVCCSQQKIDLDVASPLIDNWWLEVVSGYASRVVSGNCYR
ncbi:MAG: hypothetical protein MUO92_03450 [Dehalococcoidales bacterium]|nr:hypothetical protein [Dehalococcoidales bacterium]